MRIQLPALSLDRVQSKIHGRETLGRKKTTAVSAILQTAFCSLCKYVEKRSDLFPELSKKYKCECIECRQYQLNLSCYMINSYVRCI